MISDCYSRMLVACRAGRPDTAGAWGGVGMASVTWGRLGSFMLVACAVAVEAVAGPAAVARPVSTSAVVSATAAVRAQSPAALTAAARVIPRCTAGQLRVRADRYMVGTGHVADVIGLWNA